MAGANLGSLGSSTSRLTPFQEDFLRAFFRSEKGFFLTGGGALAGFYLFHRTTRDIDLFTTSGEAFERGKAALMAVAEGLGARLTVMSDAPEFRRVGLERASDVIVIDLVRDRVPQIRPEKTERAGIRLDPLEEILVNKLAAVLSRMEERDLVDLYFLERASLRVEDFLALALQKDGACTPGALAYVLSQIRIPDDAHLPAEMSGRKLAGYVRDLERRLLALAAPRQGEGAPDRPAP